MKNLMFIPLIILLSVVSLYGQQVENASEFKTPGVGYDMSGAEEQAAFLNWSRVRMDHSVSMSMGGSALGSQSYLTYRYQIYMPLTSNLSFYGNLYWELQTSASSPALERLNSP